MIENTDSLLEIIGLRKSLIKRDGNVSHAFARIARGGIPKRHFEIVRKNTGLPVQTLSRVLHITPRTIQKKRASDLLDPFASEKLLELSRLFARGIEVFEDRNKFSRWLNLPCRALGNEVPLELLDTSFGFELVNNELGRMEHGIIS